MKRKICLLPLILVFLLTTNVAAGSYLDTSDKKPSATHDLLLDAVSWESIPINCLAGDTLSGEFRIVSDGNLFPGDETKYDNWLLGGIDFLILDEENYDFWVDDSAISPVFERHTQVKLTWSIEIAHDGVWYVVYSNDSIFMKQIEGTINRSGPNDGLLLWIGMIGVASLLILTAIHWKKK